MSELIKTYSDMEGPTILMVDEVNPKAPEKKYGGNLIYDWTSLELSPKVDLIMAVSPAPNMRTGQSFQLLPPTHPTIFTHQMLEGHRNFAQLHRLVSCVKVHNKDLLCKKDKDTVSLIGYHSFVV